MRATSIPISNLFYMLCYAWDRLDLMDSTAVGTAAYDHTENLFARLLIESVGRAQRRGIFREYDETTEEVPGVKGRLEIAASIKNGALIRGHAVCTFDEFSENNLANQVLKWGLMTLCKASEIAPTLRYEIMETLELLAAVSDAIPSERDFLKLSRMRLSPTYIFGINICHLIFKSVGIGGRDSGQITMLDLFEDEREMAKLFQDFVKNFYRREQNQYPTVRSERLDWQATSESSESLELLPSMIKDITLENSDQTLIIDTKFYREMFQSSHHGSSKLRSGHLYQLNAYLIAKRARRPGGDIYGALLYPAVKSSPRLDYVIGPFPVRVGTVDLGMPWNEIKQQLIEFIQIGAA